MNKTEANKKARKIIADKCEELGIESCEIGFPGCMRTFGVAPAHHRPRIWYRGDVKALSDYKNWVVADSYCHEILDNRNKTTQEESDAIFKRLRPIDE